MQNKNIYNGIEMYRNKKNNTTTITVFVMLFIIVFLGTFSLAIKIFDLDIVKKGVFTEEQIENYIDIADEASKGKAQVNWQEMMAVAMALYDGDLKLIEDSDITTIAESFLQQGQEGNYYIKDFQTVLKNLNLQEDKIVEVEKYLEEISNASIYQGLYEDNEKIEFIETIKQQAYINYEEYNILPSITIGQAILESGWGQSELALEHNNLFGIKADSRWSGDIATMVTGENYSDTVEASFRKYNSFLESIQDHGLFLYENERYTVNGVFSAKDYQQQAIALENAGYSTAKNEQGELIYADKLINVIRNYNLMLYDTEVERADKMEN